ncbi:MAG: hypothetical protein VX986_04640 [Pseudomonadota bacterium]|nr:hypothetical protein [Pseudomonadota bacterium]
MEHFDKTKYISLQTKKRDGRTVNTPLWCVTRPEDIGQRIIYAFTNKNSGKVKRIQINSSAKISKCSVTGRVQSKWLDTEVTTSFDQETMRQIVSKMYRKYSWQMLLVDILARLSGRRSSWIVLKIAY